MIFLEDLFKSSVVLNGYSLGCLVCTIR